ncbi:MAG: hypothetical protein JNL36_00200 [Candidatus Kapabacteria bacterium]|nr:hypothetical protein [Candidatus Kapabacteria bacterium]
MVKTLYRWVFWIVFVSITIAVGLGIWYGIDITKRFLNPLIQTKTDALYIVKKNSSRSNLSTVPFEHDLLLMNLLLDSMNAHLKLKYILTTDVKTRKKATKDVHSTVYKSLVEELNKLHYSYTDYQVLRKNCVKTLLSKIPLQNLKGSTISEHSEGKKQQNLLFDMMKQFDRDYIFSDSIRTPAYSYVKEYTVESLIPRMLPILLGFDKKP